MSNRITQFCMGYSELQGCKGICFPITQIKETYCTIDSTSFQHQHTNTVADLFFWHLIEVTAIVFNSNDSECFAARSKRAIILETLSVILYLFHSLFLLFLYPLSNAIKRAAEKDYRIIWDAGVEDLIWGILHLLSHIAAEQGAFSFTPCCGAYQKENTVPTLECQECLIILLRHKKDFGVPGSKCVSLEGLGVISVSSADAQKY